MSYLGRMEELHVMTCLRWARVARAKVKSRVALRGGEAGARRP
jgi:hypothetical protein